MKTLKKLQLNDAKVLSNSEMKKILGGTGNGTDPIATWIGTILGELCGNTTCTLTIQGSDGSWITRYGHCSVGASYPHCYCETGLGDVHVTSNGGNSRCNS